MALTHLKKQQRKQSVNQNQTKNYLPNFETKHQTNHEQMQQNSLMILLYQYIYSLIPVEKSGNNIFHSVLLLQFANNKNHVHERKGLSQSFKSIRSQMLFKIGALKNFALFTGKHLWSLFLMRA